MQQRGGKQFASDGHAGVDHDRTPARAIHCKSSNIGKNRLGERGTPSCTRSFISWFPVEGDRGKFASDGFRPVIPLKIDVVLRINLLELVRVIHLRTTHLALGS